MSLLQRSDVRRYWWLILLLLLVLIYWVYLLINQLHPPPFPCTPNGTCSCDTSSNFLDPDGVCNSASNTINSHTCNPVQPTTSSSGIICYDNCNGCMVDSDLNCLYNSPFFIGLGTITLFFNGAYYEAVLGPPVTPPGCSTTISLCFSYINVKSC